MTVPVWRVAGTSLAGPAHALDGSACQDSHRVHVTPGGMLIAVVSDGAGSAKYGGDGAALLCEHVVEALEWHFDQRPVDAWSRSAMLGACRATARAVSSARETAAALGDQREVGLEAFHATLVGAVMLPGKGGLFFHIGDGAALAVGQGGQRWMLSPPKNGEYADTTYFFTEANWRRNLRFMAVDGDLDTIFVMTDGVTELGLKHRENGPEPFMPFFDPIGRFLASASREDGEMALTATLDSSAMRARTGDDKTLVWAQAAR